MVVPESGVVGNKNALALAILLCILSSMPAMEKEIFTIVPTVCLVTFLVDGYNAGILPGLWYRSTSQTLVISWCSLLNRLSPPCFHTSAGIPYPPGALPSSRPAIALAISSHLLCHLLAVAFLSALYDILFDSKAHSGLLSFSFGFATQEERVFVETTRLWNLVSHREAMSMLYLASSIATSAVRLSGRSAASRSRSNCQ